MKFFSPSATLKELKLLEFIESKPIGTSQHEMAKVIGVAASSVNIYIDKFEEKGYLVRDYQSQKIVHYNMTLKGIKRKNFLSITYYHELLSLYRLAKQNIETFLEKLENKGYENVLFYGAGEVAETILSIVKSREDKPLRVVALVDDDVSKKSNELLGYEIISRSNIKHHNHDGIVITSYTYEDEIKKKLEEINYPMDKVELFFTGM
ncbi:MAG: winged helix-turn-helix transcriptional regulator [Tissierellaceae bacterium]|nr:winged helix-turn-helix transcriptional regulator [Tissierellaceae bacterium]